MRIGVLTTRLAVLSEATSQKFDPKVSRAHASSHPPAGAQPERKGPPDPDDRLADYFEHQLEHARTCERIVAVCAEVEIRLARRLNADVQRIAGAFGVGGYTQSADRDARIVREYVGLAAAEVAAIESEAYGYCPASNVRKVRIFAKCDPETGERSERDRSEEAYALELRAQSYSIGSIALRLGRPKSTVQRWLEKAKQSAA